MKRHYSTFTNSNKLQEIIEELGIKPVFTYENLELEITKKQILKETEGLSGIYMIVNKITKDYYIGSAATNRFFTRFSNHLIYFRGSKIVKLAVKKYHLENFAFLVLDLYPHLVTKETNKELLNLEDLYLKLLLPNYNILTEAGSSFGYKHTEIDRQKMKDIYSDTRRERIGHLNRGKKLSLVPGPPDRDQDPVVFRRPGLETIEKLRLKAIKRLPMSLETCPRHFVSGNPRAEGPGTETKKKCITNTRPVILYNLNGTVYGSFLTIKEAAKAINCHEKTIRRAFKTDKKLVKRQ
jgi:group I intron endonuclease